MMHIQIDIDILELTYSTRPAVAMRSVGNRQYCLESFLYRRRRCYDAYDKWWAC